MTLAIDDYEIPYILVTKTKTLLIVEFQINQTSGIITTIILDSKVYDSSNNLLPQQILTTRFSEIFICS